MKISGWGKNTVSECKIVKPKTLSGLKKEIVKNCIARGMGRSYGDSSIQPNKTIVMTNFSKVIKFDHIKGIIKVEAGGPAEQAGVQPNDIVFELYGKQFAGFSGFRRKLLGLMPGQEINLTIFRGGETIAITSILGKKNVEGE